MTVEEFYHKCMNVCDTTSVHLWSYQTMFFNNTYLNMPDEYRNLHVGTFYVDNKRCEIHVQEYRR